MNGSKGFRVVDAVGNMGGEGIVRHMKSVTNMSDIRGARRLGARVSEDISVEVFPVKLLRVTKEKSIRDEMR